MRKSKYAVDLGLSNGKRIIYSPMTRKYVEYIKDEMDVINFLDNLDKSEFSYEELMMFSELFEAKLVCKDADNELEAFQIIEDEKRNKSRNLNLQVHMDESRELGSRLSEGIVSSILSEAKKNAKNSRVINISWCGAETVEEISEIQPVMDELELIAKRYRCKLNSTMCTSAKNITAEDVIQMKGCLINKVKVSISGKQAPQILDKIMNNVNMFLEVGIEVKLDIDLKHMDTMYVRRILGSVPNKYRKMVGLTLSNELASEKKHSKFMIYRMSFDMGYLNYNRENSLMSLSAENNDTYVFNGEVKTSRKKRKPSSVIISNGMTLEESAYLDYYFDKTKEKLA